MILICYTLHYRPYLKKTISKFEIFNELTLLSCSYFLIVFCDILIDYDMRYYIGWYMACVTLFNIMVNYLNLLYSLFKEIKKKCQNKCCKKQASKKGQSDLKNLDEPLDQTAINKEYSENYNSQ